MSEYRYSLAVAAFGLVPLLTGAVLTNASTNNVTANGYGYWAHIGTGLVLTILALIQSLVFPRKGTLGSKLSWVATGLLILEAVAGVGRERSTSAGLVVLHACLAPLTFSALVMVSLALSPSREEHLPISDGNALALRRIALFLPPLALLQIVFGALYRHKIWGVLPHMGGALLVLLLTLILCTILVQQITAKSPLKTVATIAISVVLTQATLGIGAFVMRLLDSDTGRLFDTIASLHVTIASLTLASTVALAYRSQKIALGASQ